MNDANQTTLRAYGDLFETLSADTLERLDDLVHEDVLFRDPFHEVRGRNAMKRIMAGMFRAFEAPRFSVRDIALSENRGYLEWRFESEESRGSTTTFEGMSAVTFSPDAHILTHRDYWDAAGAIHAHLPLIGPVIRMINRTIVKRTG
jgi:steroid Delta-isomerase